MDNFHLDITCEGREKLGLALAIFAGANVHRVTGYRVCPDKGLILYQYGSSDKSIPLPFKMDMGQAADFVANWLAQQDYEQWDSEPDFDGSVGKGWRAYTESWGQIGGEYQAFVAIKPTYAWYGK